VVPGVGGPRRGRSPDFPPVPPGQAVQKGTKRFSDSVSSSMPLPSDVDHVSCIPTPASDKLAALELCAGSAGITQALSAVGFLAHGVDHQKNRHKPKAATAKIDLASAEGQEILNSFLRVAVIFFTWMGPPCGTASRAREIPLTKAQVRAGAPVPVPSRSEAHPRGFPWLTGLDATKVALANSIYDYFSDYIDECLASGRLFCIENPRGSWLWSLPRYKQLLLDKRIFVVDFQACMFGSDRPKWTRLVTNCAEIAELAVKCDNSHIHSEWGVVQQQTGSWKFRTADEAEYPAILCEAVAAKVAKAAVRLGFGATWDKQQWKNSQQVNTTKGRSQSSNGFRI